MTRHPARDDAERVRAEPRRRAPKDGRFTPWRCPRCRSTGDPRACQCMRTIRRRLDEARLQLRRGRPSAAEVELACASELLDLLTKDAIKAAGGNTGG